MNVLVTGGLGFIGQHLCNKLKKDHNVSFIDYKVTNSVQDSNIEKYNPSIIFHLAATARVGVSLEDPAGVIDNNISSLLKVLEYCRSNPHVKLIFASSSSAKFANLKRNPYALSKAMGEQLIELYRETYSVKATSVRFFNVYGPGEADYGSNTTLVKQCKKQILAGKPLYIDGEISYD